MINPVKYVLYDSTVPDSNPPVIVVNSDEMAYGTVTFTRLPIKHVPTPTMSSKIYAVVPPTATEQRWIRTGSEITTANLLSANLYHPEEVVQIIWQFLPTVISAVDGDYYSVEFYINKSISSAVAQGTARIIVKIKDRLL
jgi:D-aminopeptidase